MSRFLCGKFAVFDESATRSTRQIVVRSYRLQFFNPFDGVLLPLSASPDKGPVQRRHDTGIVHPGRSKGNGKVRPRNVAGIVAPDALTLAPAIHFRAIQPAKETRHAGLATGQALRPTQTASAHWRAF